MDLPREKKKSFVQKMTFYYTCSATIASKFVSENISKLEVTDISSKTNKKNTQKIRPTNQPPMFYSDGPSKTEVQSQFCSEQTYLFVHEVTN